MATRFADKPAMLQSFPFPCAASRPRIPTIRPIPPRMRAGIFRNEIEAQINATLAVSKAVSAKRLTGPRFGELFASGTFSRGDSSPFSLRRQSEFIRVLLVYQKHSKK